jgi:hypothetical protein
MYCCRCGAELPQQARFCPSCGQPVETALPVGSRSQKHLPVLALLWATYAVLELAVAGLRAFAGTIIAHFWFGPWGMPGRWMHGVIWGLSLYALILGLAGLVGAWGAWQREPWSRPLLLVLGVLALLHLPLGTALGLYTLWVLLPEQAASISRPT